MNPDPKQWTVPLFVAVGLIISQLFIYGKKVKRRVTITTAELLGDVMQFGVRMVITIATIRGIELVTKHPLDDMWQVVATTILICTSFDTYFVQIREIALQRVVGAAGVLFGRMPEDAMVELAGNNDHPGGSMRVTTVTGINKLDEKGVKAGLPLRKAYLPDGADHEDQQEFVDLLGNMSGPPVKGKPAVTDDQE